LDAALERVFDVATAWKAIVLIDEVGFLLLSNVLAIDVLEGRCVP